MKPAHAASKNFVPVKISWLKARRSLVGSVVKNHRRAHAIAAVAIDRGNVWAANPVVRESLIEWLDAHRSDTLGNQLTDRIVHHRRHYPGPQPKAISQIGRDVIFTAAYMNLTFSRFAERNDPRINA